MLCQSISIHAPRVGSDDVNIAIPAGGGDFNPRSPCGERRFIRHVFADSRLFQSTLPVWGATRWRYCKCQWQRISIHAPRVGSDEKFMLIYRYKYISIHAPRVGSDPVEAVA